MILTKFSKIVQKTKEKNYFKTLIKWLIKRIEKPSKKNEDLILQKEFFIGKNSVGDFLILPKSETGRNLSKSLYNYVLSLEEQEKARFEHFCKKKRGL